MALAGIVRQLIWIMLLACASASTAWASYFADAEFEAVVTKTQGISRSADGEWQLIAEIKVGKILQGSKPSTEAALKLQGKTVQCLLYLEKGITKLVQGDRVHVSWNIASGFRGKEVAEVTMWTVKKILPPS